MWKIILAFKVLGKNKLLNKMLNMRVGGNQ